MYSLKLFQYSALLLVLLPGLLFAEDTKVRFVNVPKIMQEAPQVKAANERLNSEFSKQIQELEECDEDIAVLDGKLRREGREMEERTRERMIDTIRQKQRECKAASTEFQTAYNERKSEELGELNKLINGIIERIADDKGIDLIVGPPIIYTSEAIDITDKVLDQLTKKK